MHVKLDQPICRPEDDTLGRAKLAKEFAGHIYELPANSGAVVGVLAPWGAGKTSFLNLARYYFKTLGIHVFQFNPWQFGTTEHIARRFFEELSADIGHHDSLRVLGKAIRQYGDKVSTLVTETSKWLGTPKVGEFIAAVLQLSKQNTSVENLRQKVEKILEKQKPPIVVMLDDIDRLSANEIWNVLKLVRLTANFPNMTYILAFDQIEVERTLDKQDFSGRDYLTKIIQIPYDLPIIPRHVISKEIRFSLKNIETFKWFDRETWDRNVDTIQPFFKNIRDVRRYVASFQWTMSSFKNQISPSDVLVLEALRVFQPDIFRQFPNCIDDLTGVSHLHQSSKREFEEHVYEREAKQALPELSHMYDPELYEPQPDTYDMNSLPPSESDLETIEEGMDYDYRPESADRLDERLRKFTGTAIGKQSHLVHDMIVRTFPKARWNVSQDRYNQKGRVANKEVLQMYLDRFSDETQYRS